AAVQVGVLRRVVVLDCSQDRTDYLELINPEIIDTEGEQREQEGCLSLPGECGITLRPAVVRVKAQDREGNWCVYKGEGLKARCFCHEIDHLDGILFTDREIKDVSEIQNETGSGQ
ncbi:MAG: peptide deformylase, partial [Clostridia bacterium]|nr:peptide deformylase [Clostridia bacterium]